MGELESWVSGVKTSSNLPIRLALWNGQHYDFGAFDNPSVTLRVNGPAAMTRLLTPSLDNLGEAYVKGEIDVEGKLSDVIDMSYALAGSSLSAIGPLGRITRHFNHTKQSDKRSIEFHYDVSNDFYQLWLDKNMVYSCAYFEQGDEDLDTAQEKKIDHILTKIQVQPGQTLLDIGCGWGALVIRAAKKFGAKCVGVTLSQNQYDLATERVRKAGLQDQIEIRIQDYRDVEGQFDRITSVGMFEHVGRKNLTDYFAKMASLLKDDGVAMNHGITSTDPDSGETAMGGGEFIDKYVFPNGELPHISLALESMQRGGSKRATSRVCVVTTRVRSRSGRNASKRRRRACASWRARNASACGACIWPVARMRSNTIMCRFIRSCAARRGSQRRACRGRAATCTRTRSAAKWLTRFAGRRPTRRTWFNRVVRRRPYRHPSRHL